MTDIETAIERLKAKRHPHDADLWWSGHNHGIGVAVMELESLASRPRADAPSAEAVLRERRIGMAECIAELDCMFYRAETPDDVVSAEQIAKNKTIQSCVNALLRLKSSTSVAPVPSASAPRTEQEKPMLEQWLREQINHADRVAAADVRQKLDGVMQY
jgi:hypothetical protein